MRKLVADRKSLALGPGIGVDADIVRSAIAEGPAGLIRAQIVLRPQYGLGLLDVSLDADRYAGRVDFAHELTRLYDCREFIHQFSRRRVFCERDRSASDNPAARSRDKPRRRQH